MSSGSAGQWCEVKRSINESAVTFRCRTAMESAINYSDYPTLVAITWEFGDYEDPFKFQGSVEEHHYDLEQSLNNLEREESGFLILVKTGEGVKEWLWYVKDFDDWLSQLNQAFSGKPAFPININHFDEPEWDTFKQLQTIVTE